MMAMSKAKKARQKLAQRGLMNPEQLRGSWNGVKPGERKTPTLQERVNKLHTKHKRNHAGRSDDSFCIYCA
ncbi:hypothetical protein [Paenibacillus sp. Leaf72]|nr:hypothetical protein [Paenibacillus sp. Leaf72]